MYICVSCKREMRCDKNGVGADFGNGHVYAADRFKCPVCGTEILVSNRNANHDPNYDQQGEYLKMRQGEFSEQEMRIIIARTDEKGKL